MENYQPPKAKANRKQQLSLHSQHFQQRHTPGQGKKQAPVMLNKPPLICLKHNTA